MEMRCLASLEFIPYLKGPNYVDHNPDCNLDCYLDHDPENVPVYAGHSLFNAIKCITLLLIVQSLLHRNPPYIWIKIIQVPIQIECLHGIKCLDSDHVLDCNLDYLVPCKQGIREYIDRGSKL